MERKERNNLRSVKENIPRPIIYRITESLKPLAPWDCWSVSFSPENQNKAARTPPAMKPLSIHSR